MSAEVAMNASIGRASSGVRVEEERTFHSLAELMAFIKEVDGDVVIGQTADQCTDMDYLGLLSPEDTDYPCDTLKALAQPYAEHADFDPEWRI